MIAERIKRWPTKERPRERLLSEGPEKLTDADLLAIILRVGSGKEPFMSANGNICVVRKYMRHFMRPAHIVHAATIHVCIATYTDFVF